MFWEHAFFTKKLSHPYEKYTSFEYYEDELTISKEKFHAHLVNVRPVDEEIEWSCEVI